MRMHFQRPMQIAAEPEENRVSLHLKFLRPYADKHAYRDLVVVETKFQTSVNAFGVG